MSWTWIPGFQDAICSTASKARFSGRWMTSAFQISQCRHCKGQADVSTISMTRGGGQGPWIRPGSLLLSNPWWPRASRRTPQLCKRRSRLENQSPPEVPSSSITRNHHARRIEREQEGSSVSYSLRVLGTGQGEGGTVDTQLLHDRLIGEGKALESCELFGDSLDRRVVFDGGEVAALAGTPVRLEMTMSDAEVYAFQFGA